MPVRSKIQATLVAATLALTLTAAIPAAAAFDCEQQVNRALQERNVSPTDVQSVQVVRRSGGAKSSSNYSLDAWVRLHSCTNGALIVSMTRYCMVQGSYTTGDCRVGDIPRY